MKPDPGIGRLQTPDDLLGKLRHDLQRLRGAPGDSFAAYDFFVTAEHMLDWVLPGHANDAKRSQLRSSNVLLGIVSHVANGSKHFVVESPRHQSVQHCNVAPSSSIGLSTSAGSGIERVFVSLEGPAILQFGPTMGADDLAERIVRFWESYLSTSSAKP